MSVPRADAAVAVRDADREVVRVRSCRSCRPERRSSACPIGSFASRVAPTSASRHRRGRATRGAERNRGRLDDAHVVVWLALALYEAAMPLWICNAESATTGICSGEPPVDRCHQREAAECSSSGPDALLSNRVSARRAKADLRATRPFTPAFDSGVSSRHVSPDPARAPAQDARVFLFHCDAYDVAAIRTIVGAAIEELGLRPTAARS